MKRNPNTITLGSGKLYIKEFKESIGDVAQLIKDMATDEFLLGRIQGGASLEYKPNFYTAKDDFGYVTKTIITEEEATLKAGFVHGTAQCLKSFAQLVGSQRIPQTGCVS